jgi:hypothetical protein
LIHRFIPPDTLPRFTGYTASESCEIKTENREVVNLESEAATFYLSTKYEGEIRRKTCFIYTLKWEVPTAYTPVCTPTCTRIRARTRKGDNPDCRAYFKNSPLPKKKKKEKKRRKKEPKKEVKKKKRTKKRKRQQILRVFQRQLHFLCPTPIALEVGE